MSVAAFTVLSTLFVFLMLAVIALAVVAWYDR